MKERILIIDDVGDLFEDMSNLFNDDLINVHHSKSDISDLKKNMRYDYYFIIINYDGLEHDVEIFSKYIMDYLNSLPLIFLASEDKKNYVSLTNHNMTFIKKPIDYEIFKRQFDNTMSILESYRNINDLSHFPGNFSINDVLKDKINNHSKFTVMYLDIDKFKAFTDYYGLYRANLIIKYLANLIVENVVKYGSPDDFIGHVGGDDFVIIFNDYESAKVVGDKIIEDFDLNVPSFYDEEDLENNYIPVLNRKGVLQRFGIVTLSITVVSNEFKDYNFTDEVYKQMMVIKREAKMVGGSILLQDIPD